MYQLTNELIRRAGFSNPDKVKIYGYGGNLQNEVLDDAYLRSHDDLKEVPTYVSNGRRFSMRKVLLVGHLQRQKEEFAILTQTLAVIF